jgi:hypothetical protein
VTSDDRISAFFGDRLARPFFEISINRDDFGARRLQFSTPCRDIERVSARTNDHDQLVSCDDRWIFFDNNEAAVFFACHDIYLKVPGLVSVFELPSIKLSIPPFELPSFRADYPRNGRARSQGVLVK